MKRPGGDGRRSSPKVGGVQMEELRGGRVGKGFEKGTNL